MSRTQDKVCIVTGAASGIGRACATRLGEQGAKLALFDRQDAEGEALAAELNDRGIAARYWHVDVVSEANVSAAIDDVVAHYGALHGLVNNAGISGSPKPTHELTEAEWDLVQAVNVKGVFLCTKHAIPHLKAAGGGSIVNLSSMYGLVGSADMPAYHASKGAVRLMTKADAMVYAEDRIRVNSVHPGLIWTPMVWSSGPREEHEKWVRRHTLLNRLGEPADIGAAVAFLASDDASFITGTHVVVDGGQLARM